MKSNWKSWLGLGRWEKRMDSEFQFHLDNLIADLMRQGMTREDAERRAQLERQLAEAQARPPGPPPVAPQPGGASGVTQQIGEAEAQLMLLKLRLPSDHPDVVGLERTIADIKAAAAKEAARAESRAAAAAQAPPVRDVREIQDEIAGVDRQMAATRSEEARLMCKPCSRGGPATRRTV